MGYFPSEKEGIGGHFARFMCELAKSEDPRLLLAARLAVDSVQNGHVCVDLALVHRFGLLTENDRAVAPVDIRTWITAVGNTAVVGSAADYRPLILDNTRLYLHAYWDYEQTLARLLSQRASRWYVPADPIRFASLIRRYFPQGGPQSVACCIAGMKNLLVLSGGPGTGKTTTVAKIAAFLLDYGAAGQGRIALAAPTGKAAARLMQSMRQASADAGIPEAIQNALPRQAFTIHRLLGAGGNARASKYDGDNPLPYDIVVVDEASMADLALLTTLFRAVSEDAKIIVVGDKDQLASVDAGAVLGDICDSGALHGVTEVFVRHVSSMLPELSLPAIPGEPPIADAIVELKKNYRFKKDSGIGALGMAIKDGDAHTAWNIVENGNHSDMSRRSLPAASVLYDELRKLIIGGYGAFYKQTDPAASLDIFHTFRVLCALNNGPYGVEGINAVIERILAEAGILRPFSRWYAGRPIMVIANDYHLGLFNGDCGITAPDPTANFELKVFFPGDTSGNVRSFSPSRLPRHETVYAMTVHKAQGSEFDNVLFIAPPVFSPILSRELLYTAVTRARESCELWCSKEIFQKAVENRTMRMSGLREKLWTK